MRFTYPAQFINEDNGSISVFFPDLQGCFTGGWGSLEEAFLMAKDALEGHIEVLAEQGETLPKPSKFTDVKIPYEIAGEKVNGGFTMLVAADVENIKKLNKPVKKTLSIPYWLNAAAEKEHINFSRVLQEALKERLAN
ncbi:MAG: type II toxin-antitoxin system HicB family antitoxin [Oscillospiraceae bacterium]|nr:type II toxin-antitoxin system HicB family antitoxin [Oscillospiraceae bacterium]